MKIERKPANRMTLEAFADKHGLTMEIGERTRLDLHHSFKYEENRFYASFKDVDVLETHVIVGAHGNGGSEDAAMQDYAEKISGKLLVFKFSDKKRRKEFYAPELTAEGK
jgi:hypothetical protein